MGIRGELGVGVLWFGAGFGEEGFEELGAFFAEDIGGEGALVIEFFVLEKVEDATGGAVFFRGAAKDDAADAAMDDGAGAHGAGFFGDVEVAFIEAPVFDDGFGLGEGEHFGVGGGVVQGFDLIEGARDDLGIANDDGADGDFLGGVCASRLAECFLHEVGIALEVDEIGIVDVIIHAGFGMG